MSLKDLEPDYPLRYNKLVEFGEKQWTKIINLKA